MITTIRQHLELYGIQHFTDDEYWVWGAKTLGPKHRKDLNRIRKPLENGQATKKQLRKFYDYVAQRDVAPVVHSMKADAVRASAEFVAPRLKGKILDVGCNIGYLTTWYARLNPDASVTGIDESSKSIALAKEYAKEIGIENVEFYEDDLENWIGGRVFDCIVDTQGVIDHEISVETLEKILNSLNENGRILCMPVLPSPGLVEEFVQKITTLGAVVQDFSVARYQDVGQPGIYPCFQIRRRHVVDGLSADFIANEYMSAINKLIYELTGSQS